MSNDYNRYLRARLGRLLQEDGVDQTSYGTLNIGNGLELTEEPSANRHTLSVNIEDFSLLTVFTSSNGGLTFLNEVTPSAVLKGTFSSGSQVAVTASLNSNYNFHGYARAIVQNTVTSGTVWTKGINVFCTYISGSTPTLDFINIMDDNYPAVNMNLSASIVGNNIAFSLTSGTGSLYTYRLLAGGSHISF